MTTRTRSELVTFRQPFRLSGFDEPQPAGTYSVEVDEERLDGLSFQAYRRVAVLLHLRPAAGHPGRSQTLTVDPAEFDAALARDLDAEGGPPPAATG